LNRWKENRQSKGGKGRNFCTGPAKEAVTIRVRQKTKEGKRILRKVDHPKMQENARGRAAREERAMDAGTRKLASGVRHWGRGSNTARLLTVPKRRKAKDQKTHNEENYPNGRGRSSCPMPKGNGEIRENEQPIQPAEPMEERE